MGGGGQYFAHFPQNLRGPLFTENFFFMEKTGSEFWGCSLNPWHSWYSKSRVAQFSKVYFVLVGKNCPPKFGGAISSTYMYFLLLLKKCPPKFGGAKLDAHAPPNLGGHNLKKCPPKFGGATLDAHAPPNLGGQNLKKCPPKFGGGPPKNIKK